MIEDFIAVHINKMKMCCITILFYTTGLVGLHTTFIWHVQHFQNLNIKNT